MTSSQPPTRDVRHIADTSYLVCFGVVKGGTHHLKSIFGGFLGSPLAVRRELQRLGDSRSKSREVRGGANVFCGRGQDITILVRLHEVDVAERDNVLRCIAGGTLPGKYHGQWPEDLGEVIDEATTGENAGEAEGMALALRLGLPFLTNDGPARGYGKDRGIAVECVAESLRRLPGTTPRQKFQIARDMERGGYLGVPVRGCEWFREPSPRDR